jgi:hypothetical protein
MGWTSESMAVGFKGDMIKVAKQSPKHHGIAQRKQRDGMGVLTTVVLPLFPYPPSSQHFTNNGNTIALPSVPSFPLTRPPSLQQRLTLGLGQRRASSASTLF